MMVYVWQIYGFSGRVTEIKGKRLGKPGNRLFVVRSLNSCLAFAEFVVPDALAAELLAVGFWPLAVAFCVFDFAFCVLRSFPASLGFKVSAFQCFRVISQSCRDSESFAFCVLRSEK